MKLSNLFLTTASADLLLPQIGTNPVTRTFADAVKYCQDNFSGGSIVGRLADPTQYGKQQLLDATHGIAAWVGAYRASAQNKFFAIRQESSFHELVYAEESDLKWSSGEPNNVGGHEYCTILQDIGTLNDFNCFVSRPFLCEGTYGSSRSEDTHSIIDQESAAAIREQQGYENQEILFNEFLDLAIREAEEMSTEHAKKLTNIKKTMLRKIQFSDRELCDGSLYAEDRYQLEFYYWNLSHTITEHEDVCEIFRDVHDGIIHFIHEFGCTGNVKIVDKKFTNFLPFFCPDLKIVQKPFGIHF